MSDLTTTYMGLQLQTPIVVAASSISSYLERIQNAELAGAGALVIRSLFEEQILMGAQCYAESLAVGAESFAEALSYFPDIEHGGTSEHLMWVERTRKDVKMPLIASLNAVSPGAWTQYAKQLEGTGVDALELNVYAVATDPRVAGAVIEAQMYEIVQAVREEVGIPVSVKLSPYYTSVANVATKLDLLGVSALVLFNRFLQPDIDPETESFTQEMVYSTPQEMKLPLRWVGLLYGRIQADLALSTGVHSGRDAAKAILAGAQVVQVASALLEKGIPYLSTMLRDLEAWMEEHEYADLHAFRGKMSQKNVDNPFAFERAQYVKLLADQK
ncbi:MAG TPA: dihydroorotate dehydrogenase-like protein [Chloroflexi bacterium]|nr:dihydroorotate dehydrogenase-like protein [Chloroflexota bacterium]